MKWFRSNVRHGSRLALFALAIQVLLSFGHFHVSGAQATPALMDESQPGLHDTVGCAATSLDAWAGASHEDAFRVVGLKTSDHESDGRPTDDCAICAVMALANALVQLVQKRAMREVHRAELRQRRFSISRAAHLLILIALRERFGIAGSQPNAARTAAFHSASGNNCDWRMHASQIE